MRTEQGFDSIPPPPLRLIAGNLPQFEGSRSSKPVLARISSLCASAMARASLITERSLP